MTIASVATVIEFKPALNITAHCLHAVLWNVVKKCGLLNSFRAAAYVLGEKRGDGEEDTLREGTGRWKY